MADCDLKFDYLFVHDVVAATAEQEAHRSAASVEPGWIYEVRIESSAERAASYLLRGAGEADLPMTVAIAVARAREFEPTADLAAAPHSVHDSTDKFDELFAHAFDLRVGAPELLHDVELHKYPLRAYALRNPSDRRGPSGPEPTWVVPR